MIDLLLPISKTTNTISEDLQKRFKQKIKIK